MFTGTIANAVAIIVGGSIGMIFGRWIPERFGKTITQGMSLAVLLIGLKGALEVKGDDVMLVIFSLIAGICIGEALDIEKRLENLGHSIQDRFSAVGGNFTKGFVTASLIYCVGSMAIMGALQSGLEGKHDILFAKSALDGTLSLILASTLGFGVVASSVPILLYQGGLAAGASLMKPLLVPGVVSQMSVVGGLLIASIGINVLEMAKIRVGNMLPAIFMPLLWYGIRQLM